MKRKLLRTICLLLIALLLVPFINAPAAANVSITAPSAIVVDYDTGEILYAKDIDTMRVPASMTKIMTAYILFEEMAAGNYTKESLMTVSSNAAALSRNSNYPAVVPLTSGGSYTVDQLLGLMMVPSASASCVVVAENISGTEAAFVERMNQTAARMGFRAEYQNSHGAQPHYITARGIATLICNFIREYPGILEYTSLRSITFNGTRYTNTNRLLPGGLNAYPGTDGFKTGTIPAAGYCHAASVLRDGRRLISVVMGASNTTTRNTDAIAILNYGFEEMARRDASRAATQLSISLPSEIRRGTDFDVTARTSGVDVSYLASGAAFTVNGEVVKSYDALEITNLQEFSLSHMLSENVGDSADIGFNISFHDGTKREVSVSVPMSSKPPALYRDTDGHWAEAVIDELTEHGVFLGDGTGYFRPMEGMNRAAFISTLYRVAESLEVDTTVEKQPQFADVLPGDWFYDSVAWGYSIGIIDGYGESFGPYDTVSRQQAITMLFRFLRAIGIDLDDNDELDEDIPDGDELDEELPDGDELDEELPDGDELDEELPDGDEFDEELPDEEDLDGELPDGEEENEDDDGANAPTDHRTNFSDEDDISDWAIDAIVAAEYIGLVTGYDDGSFMPQNTLTRADASALLHRFINLLNP